jgi:hypothetical protein
MSNEDTGARYEIAIDGTPRSHRDRKELVGLDAPATRACCRMMVRVNSWRDLLAGARFELGFAQRL